MVRLLTGRYDTSNTAESDNEGGSESTLAVSENVILAVGDDSGDVAL